MAKMLGKRLEYFVFGHMQGSSSGCLLINSAMRSEVGKVAFVEEGRHTVGRDLAILQHEELNLEN